MRRIDKIIIHCADTPTGRDVNVNEIRGWHLDRGWSDVGYHYVIKIDGTIEVGRQEEVTGAHCRGYNSASIGVCMIGRDVFNDEQYQSLGRLVKSLQARYKASVHGHYEFSDKTCPNFDVGDWYAGLD